MERFQIKPHEWAAMGETEDGQYAQAELMEYVAERAQMMTYEHHLQKEEYDRLYGKK